MNLAVCRGATDIYPQVQIDRIVIFINAFLDLTVFNALPKLSFLIFSMLDGQQVRRGLLHI
jgi:hypothetical protein